MTTHGLSAPFRHGTIWRGAWTRTISPGWSRGTSSRWTMRAAWLGRWRTIWRRRRTGFEGMTDGSPHVYGDIDADRRKRRPSSGPARRTGGSAPDRYTARSRVIRGRGHRQDAGPVSGAGRD